MYNINGDFGEVRMVTNIVSPEAAKVYNQTSSIGWHKCNSKYKIRLENGCRDYLLLFTVGGSGALLLNNKKYRLLSNRIAIIPPKIPVEYYTPENEVWEFYWAHIDGEFVARLLDATICRFDFVIEYEDITPQTDGIEQLLFIKKSGRMDFEIQASLVISKILHEIQYPKQTKRSESTKKQSIYEMIRYIETNYKQKISIEQMSRQFYMSKTHLIRIFKAQTDYTPYDYLKTYRILMAKQLLLYSDLTVEQIAKEVGFASTGNFISQFKSVTKSTPNKYRRREL